MTVGNEGGGGGGGGGEPGRGRGEERRERGVRAEEGKRGRPVLFGPVG